MKTIIKIELTEEEGEIKIYGKQLDLIKIIVYSMLKNKEFYNLFELAINVCKVIKKIV